VKSVPKKGGKIMTKKSIIPIILTILLIPLTTPAQSEGIPLQKDILLESPILAPEDLPEEITFTLFGSKTATEPLGFQTFTRGQYTVDFQFRKSDGVSGGDVARVSADFTKTLNLKDSEGESIQPKEIWVALEVADGEVGERSKVSDETLVRLLLASDASIATYLTLVYEGDDNPITTVYKDLPISSLSSDGSGNSLKNYFSAVAVGASEGAIEPNNPGDIVNIWREGDISNSVYYNAGNVGIGTTWPLRPLHITGDSYGQLYAVGTNASKYGGASFGNETEKNMAFGVGGAAHLYANIGFIDFSSPV